MLKPTKFKEMKPKSSIEEENFSVKFATQPSEQFNDLNSRKCFGKLIKNNHKQNNKRTEQTCKLIEKQKLNIPIASELRQFRKLGQKLGENNCVNKKKEILAMQTGKNNKNLILDNKKTFLSPSSQLKIGHCPTFKQIIQKIPIENNSIGENQRPKTPKCYSQSERKVNRYSSVQKFTPNLPVIGLARTKSNKEDASTKYLPNEKSKMQKIDESYQRESVNKSVESPRQLDMTPFI